MGNLIERMDKIVSAMTLPEKLKEKWFNSHTTEDRRNVAIEMFVGGYLDRWQK